MTIKVGINGFGRIGRAVLRYIIEQELTQQIEIVHINSNGKGDKDFLATLAHLLKYDSVHGTFSAKVAIDGHCLIVNGKSISISSALSPKDCPWGEKLVDIVFECTGVFRSAAQAQEHINAGAKQVLISAPGGEGVDKTIVYGVNHQSLTSKDEIVSNASCTTNCLAPIVYALHQEFGILTGLMTTIHAYTSDQLLLDNRHSDLRRARAANLAMIPTKTGAAQAIAAVIPELAGKLSGQAIRVPTPNVSLVDLTFTSNSSLVVTAINDCLQQYANGKLAGVLATNQQPLVSIDFNHNSASSIVDLTQTLVIGNTAKVLAWYDNEWGFVARMVDTAKYMVKLHGC